MSFREPFHVADESAKKPLSIGCGVDLRDDAGFGDGYLLIAADLLHIRPKLLGMDFDRGADRFFRGNLRFYLSFSKPDPETFYFLSLRSA